MENKTTLTIIGGHGYETGNIVNTSHGGANIISNLILYIRRPRISVVNAVEASVIEIHQRKVTWKEYFNEIHRILIAGS